MIASHVAISQDARGPNNTLHQGDVSSLLALGEAVRVIERGAADVMIAGGASSRMQPFDWVRGCLTDQLSYHDGDPAEASRPFDAWRNGQVRGEGAAAFVLESRQHALARGARVLARIAGTASSIEPRSNGKPLCGCGLGRAMRAALRDARLTPEELGHVNAHGLSTVDGDRSEAAAIRDLCGAVPVTAPKSFFGNLGAASGAVELVVSLLALEIGQVPITLNYASPDEHCPIRVVHRQPLKLDRPMALVVNQTTFGQAAAAIISAL
jgi:3-oxoacyl-[acyl-carrier-protein] synthase II